MFRELLKRNLDRVLGGPLDRRMAPRMDEIRFSVGEVKARQARLMPSPTTLRETEFKVFSQWGEDGIIQFLIHELHPPDTFVELGVSDYRESNTRFLAMNDNWRGAIFNGGTAHVDFLRSTEMGWRYSIDAVPSFVTSENVNQLISATGIRDEIGLLSIDVDGVDYWLWEAISVVAPWIVVVEFNSTFGPDHAVTIPYDPTFSAASAHYTGLYFGASLAALHHLGRQKGYRLLGVTSQGVNAFFVRNDIAGDLWSLTPSAAYVRSRVRTARNRDASLAFTGDDHAAVLSSMREKQVVVVDSGETRTIREVFQL